MVYISDMATSLYFHFMFYNVFTLIKRELLHNLSYKSIIQIRYRNNVFDTSEIFLVFSIHVCNKPNRPFMMQYSVTSA